MKIGTKQQPICIPRNSTFTIPGCTSKLPPRITCLVEQAEHHNLLLAIVINWCVVIPKATLIHVILINTNRYYVWIRQHFLAAELFDAKCDEIEYRANMNQHGDNISVGFQPVPPQLINTNSSQVEAGPVQLDSPEIERSVFSCRPDTNPAEFNFEKELNCLPLQLNIRKEEIYVRPAEPIHQPGL